MLFVYKRQNLWVWMCIIFFLSVYISLFSKGKISCWVIELFSVEYTHTYTHNFDIYHLLYASYIWQENSPKKNILYQITKRQWLPADCWMDMHGKLTKSIKNTKEKKSKQKITNRFGVNVSMVMQGFSNCSPPKSELTDLYWC